MQVYFHHVPRPCLSFCLWHPSRGPVVKRSILPQGKVLSRHWNGTTRYIIHLSPNPCEKYRLTFLLSPWSHLRRLQERAGDPWKRSEKLSLLTLRYTITNLNVCCSICYLWRHIYSVQSCHFFRAHWKRLIRGTSAAPRRLLMKSRDGADEDLWVFLSAVFTICRSLHLCSPGKRWHPADRNVRQGWRSKVLACPGASDDSLHKSWSVGWASVSWQGSRPLRRPAGAGQGGKTPQGAPSPWQARRHNRPRCSACGNRGKVCSPHWGTDPPPPTSVRRWGRGQGDTEANTSSARPAQHGASPAPPTSGNPAWPSSREPQRPAPSRLPPRRRRAAAARWRIRRVSEAGRQGDRGSFLPFPSDRAVSLSVPQLLSRTWSWWTWSWASCPPGWPWETSPPVASWGPCEEVRGAEGRGPARPAETAPHPLGRRGPGGCESLLLTELGRSVHKHLWLLERILAVAEGSGSRGAASGRFLLFQNSASCCLLCSHL